MWASGLGICAVGLLFAIFSGRKAKESDEQVDRCPELCIATVLESKSKMERDIYLDLYRYCCHTIEYTTEAGEHYVTSTGWYPGHAAKRGKKIKIYCNPDDPLEFVIPGQRADRVLFHVVRVLGWLVFFFGIWTIWYLH